MSLEYAFLRAIESSPRSRLAKRIRRAARRPCRQTEYAGLELLSPRAQALRYRSGQLGKRWKTYRIGGCAWMGPIEPLRQEWSALRTESQGASVAQEHLLLWIAQGIGMPSSLDSRARDYLVALMASRGPEAPALCRIEGIRWFSSSTVLIEAVHDLGAHRPCDQKALHEFLSLHTPLAAEGGGEDEAGRALCDLIAQWLEIDS